VKCFAISILRGMSAHDWRTLRRGRDICGWRSFANAILFDGRISKRKADVSGKISFCLGSVADLSRFFDTFRLICHLHNESYDGSICKRSFQANMNVFTQAAINRRFRQRRFDEIL